MERLKAYWQKSWLNKGILGVGGFVMLCCVLSLALGSLAPRPAAQAPTVAAQQVAAAAQPTAKPEPSAPPKPTEAPKPTNTPKPTATPQPTAVPTVAPSPTPLPEPIVLSGKGKVVTDKFTPPAGVNRVIFEHQGRRNFIVRLFKTNGDEDYLANAIGAYHGEVLLLGRDEMYFEIDADGSWKATIEPVARADAGVELSGHGDTVSDVFEPPTSGPMPYVVTHTGKRNFIVQLVCAGGQDYVANEIGAVDGQVVVKFSDGPCLWSVQADGDWSLKPK